jgi:hypothetical protein
MVAKILDVPRGDALGQSIERDNLCPVHFLSVEIARVPDDQPKVHFS